MNQFLGKLFRLVAIGLGFLWTINAIETDLDLFIGIIQNRDGIAVGNVNDFGLEVGGEGYAGEKNP